MISGLPPLRPPTGPPVPDAPEASPPAEDVAPAEAGLQVEPASPPTSDDLQPARTADDVHVAAASPSPATPTPQPIEAAATFSPRPAALTIRPTTPAPRAANVALTSDMRLPSSSAEIRDFIRQAAQQRGIDPDTAIRVVLSEGGLTPATWVGDHGSSFGPFQLHYGGVAQGGNVVSGLGDTFTAETHLDARDPRTWKQQVEWALGRASRDGWTAWHGAAAASIGPRDGIGGVLAPTTTSTYATTLLPATAHVSVPNQFASHLSPQEAYAACGPAAAVALARYLGRNPTVAEALQLAKQTGWTLSGGMNGIANEKHLLDAMHINAQIEMPLNWRHVQLEARRGTPVIVSTPNHYFVIDDYDPVTREYHVGQSGLVYSAGAEWMTAERLQQLGGGLNGGLYINNPLVAPAPRMVQTSLDQGWSMAAAGQAQSVFMAARLDAGWQIGGSAPAPHRGAGLDPGWTKGGDAPTVQPTVHAPTATATAPTGAVPEPAPAVATIPSNDRWWEDSRPIRTEVAFAAKHGPEWV